MNVMTSFDEAPIAAEAPVDPAALGPMSHTLRRTGGRPISFAGVQLTMAMDYAPGCEMWFEINLYRTAEERYVADVRNFKRDADEQDCFSVYEADSLDAALAALEGHDPANHIAIGFDLEAADASLADLTFRALALRVRVENARRQYRTLLGQVLYDLDAGER